tara:strand:+ start:95 stop:295 length:201 start_codon:yes stop_codon:yes gene_type:complete
MQNELLTEIKDKITIIDNKINVLVESESVKDNPGAVAVLAEVASSLNVTAVALSRHKEKRALKKIT